MSDRERAIEILQVWAKGGRRATAEELCIDCPQLLPVVKNAIERLKRQPEIAAQAKKAAALKNDPESAQAANSVSEPDTPATVFGLLTGSNPAPSAPPLPYQSIGPYRIVALLGQGGMGTVYKAEQDRPIKRTVAVKVIRADFNRKEIISRFAAERQALAIMSHPHIARVLDAGATSTGTHYFVMDFVPGVPVTRFADEHRLTLKQRVELMVNICQAVAHAHGKAIIHRDIKAGNVLGYMEDGVPMVKVIDFGIAKAVAGDRLSDHTHTAQGMVIGTYEAMSPEQAAGLADIDTRADVYALGVLLYEMLSGIKPFGPEKFAEKSFGEALQMICTEEPPRPSTRVRELGPDLADLALARQMRVEGLAKSLKDELEWIPLKAMRKERERRYASALQMAGDLRNYLEGKPLSAGPESQVYKLRKFATRNVGALAAAVAVVLSLAAGLGLALWQADVAKRSEQAASASAEIAKQRAVEAADNATRAAKNEKIATQKSEELLVSEKLARENEANALASAQAANQAAARESAERKRAELAERNAKFETYVARIAAADGAIQSHNYRSAKTLLDGCDREFRGWEWSYLNRLHDDAYRRYQIRNPTTGRPVVLSDFISQAGRSAGYGLSNAGEVYAIDMSKGKVWWVIGRDELRKEGGFQTVKSQKADLMATPTGISLSGDGESLAIVFDATAYQAGGNGPACWVQVRDAGTGMTLSRIIQPTNKTDRCNAILNAAGTLLITAGPSADAPVEVWNRKYSEAPLVHWNRDGALRIHSVAFTGVANQVAMLFSEKLRLPADNADEITESFSLPKLRLFDLEKNEIRAEFALPSPAVTPRFLTSSIQTLKTGETQTLFVALSESPVIIDVAASKVTPMFTLTESITRSSWNAELISASNDTEHQLFRASGAYHLIEPAAQNHLRTFRAGTGSSGGHPESITDHLLAYINESGDLATAETYTGVGKVFRGAGMNTLAVHLLGPKGPICVIDQSGETSLFNNQIASIERPVVYPIGFDAYFRYWAVEEQGDAYKIRCHPLENGLKPPLTEISLGTRSEFRIDQGMKPILSNDRVYYFQAGTLVVLNLNTGRKQLSRLAERNDSIQSIKAAVSADGKRLAAVLNQRDVFIIDTETLQIIDDSRARPGLGSDVPIHSVTWLGRSLVVHYISKGVKILDPSGTIHTFKLPSLYHSESRLIGCPDGQYLAIIGPEQLALLDAQKQFEASYRTSLSYGSEMGAAWSSDGRRLFFGDGDRLRVVDRLHGREVLNTRTSVHAGSILVRPDDQAIILHHDFGLSRLGVLIEGKSDQ